jgi:OOP family OmpA-OmpF porin
MAGAGSVIVTSQPKILEEKMKLKVLLAVAAVSVTSLASDQWYAVVGTGATHLNLSNAYVPVQGATTSTFPKNEDSSGYKLQMGYQFNQKFALEGGYVDLGKFNITNRVTAPFVGSLRGDVKADGWNLMAVGRVSVTDSFALLGKAGTIYSTTTGDYSTSGAVFLAPGVQSSYKKSEFNLAYGVGAQYSINKTLAVRGEVERFVDLRPADTATKGSVVLYSLGLIFSF